MRRLPSLNGLRAFEAAARHGGFVGAAHELNVTQAAVSRMVRLLEERFGFQLFERRPNGLDLTAQGKALQPGLTAAFDAIAGIAEQVSAMRATPVLTLGVGPSFAVRRLVPRLRGFHERHPEIDVRLSTGGAINPFRDDWTCGILLGDGKWAGYESELLFSADLLPVCTRAVAARLTHPSKLARENLLRVSHSPEEWPLWLEAAGVKPRGSDPGPSFDNYAMALQAALDGIGIAIGLRPYVEDDLAAGRLVAPFKITVPKQRAWYLVYRSFRNDDPGLAVLRSWLRDSLSSEPSNPKSQPTGGYATGMRHLDRLAAMPYHASVQPIGPLMFARLFPSTRRQATQIVAIAAAVSLAFPLSAATVELGPPPGAVLSREKLGPIDDFINEEISAGRIPGAIVLIQRHGQPVYFKSFGKRDVESGAPMTADTIFPIHSVTKTITSLAAMMLVDRRKIALTDPVSKYIPSFAGMKVGVEKKDENGRAVLDLVPPIRPVNIEDLLLHTSGLTYGFYGEGLVKSAYADIYLGDVDNAEFVERLAKVPLAEQPRTLWDYGHSIDVLGRVIEVASGQSLYQFEKINLLDPLGMTTTKFFLTDPAERARYAQPLPRDRHVERNSLDVTRWESGGGGMVSTISDFARYGQMLLDGGMLEGKTYLSSGAFAAMTTDHIGAGSGVARNYFYYPGDGFGFGYGFGVRTDPGNAVPPPPGSLGEFKWDGATGVYLVVDRAQDMFFVLMQNSPSGRLHVQVTLKKLIYDAFEK